MKINLKVAIVSTFRVFVHKFQPTLRLLRFFSRPAARAFYRVKNGKPPARGAARSDRQSRRRVAVVVVVEPLCCL